MIQKAAKFIREAQVLIIGAGAGMGKDSGLPDFRGHQGFWNNYPPYRGKFNFQQCANPKFLKDHPHLFWGFYGHRLNMYSQKCPHQGYKLLQQMASIISAPDAECLNYFAVTSNVDGHFHRASYPQKNVYQVHGSINYLQCYNCQQIMPNNFLPQVDHNSMSCLTLPKCSSCKQALRPNILMFNDWEWLDERTLRQEANYKQFTKIYSRKPKVLIEIGCGQAVPTIRNIMQQLYYKFNNAKLIRINPDSSTSSASYLDPERYVDVNLGALEALKKIREVL